MTAQHSRDFLADVTQPGPNGITFHAMPVTSADGLDATATATALMYDGITASAVPQGTYVAGYYNGAFANLPAMRAGHPGATVVSVTPDGARGAQFIDVEPGDTVIAAIPAFLKAGGTGFYTSASQLAAAIAACAAAGIARSSYSAWSAHWTGQHICAPASCGYPQADGTQFASNASYDTSLIAAATFLRATAVTWPLREGSSGGPVAALQADLDRWGPAIGLKAPLAADGRYGPLTAAAVEQAQEYLRLPVTGTVSQALYAELQGPVPAPGWAGMSATPYLHASFSWPRQGTAAGYELGVRGAAGTVTTHQVAGTHAPDVLLGPPGAYSWRVVVPAGGAASPWKDVAG
jgi:hypothetical protein